MSETMRLELVPLGVTVVTGMLGNIESNFHKNDSWQGLSESSRYESAEAQITKSAEGKVGPKAEKADDSANRFVDDILRGALGQVWRGSMAQRVRVVGYHAPMKVLVGTNLLSIEFLLIGEIGRHALAWQWTGKHGKSHHEKASVKVDRKSCNF